MSKCEVCRREVPDNRNSVVCSDKCAEIRLAAYRLTDEYFPTNGCANCRGDLHQGCTQQCQDEFAAAIKFGERIWKLIRMTADATSEVPHAD